MTQLTDIGVLRTALVLLDEQHVTRASARLYLSVSATSRALDRCRATFHDPLLVRQGRNLVITPRGEQLRDRLRPLLNDIDGLIESSRPFDPKPVRETFAIRAGEAVVAAGAVPILTLVAHEAPRATIRFDLESLDDFDALRSGVASLAIGSYSNIPSDISTEPLVIERLVAVMRTGHPAVKGSMTVKRFAALEQLMVSRRGIHRGPIDVELEARGFTRKVAAVVPSFAAAIAMAAASDYVAIVPQRLAAALSGGAGLATFTIPVPIPDVEICQAWHHRLSEDPTHQWLRSCVSRATTQLRGPGRRPR